MGGWLGPVDDALGDATQGFIDVAQDGANAGADIGIGTTGWLGDRGGQFGDELTDLGGAAGSATVDPILAFAGLGGGGGGGGGQQGGQQGQTPNQPQAGGIPPVLLLGGAAVAVYILMQMGD